MHTLRFASRIFDLVKIVFFIVIRANIVIIMIFFAFDSALSSIYVFGFIALGFAEMLW